MRRTTALVLCCAFIACAALCAMTGCAAGSVKPWNAKNEIYTYQRVDPEKTVITMSRVGNIDLDEICTAFEEKNPDIQVILVDITGGSVSYKPCAQWLEQGIFPDVVATAANFISNDMTGTYLEKLTDNPIISAYDSQALERVAVDGDIYWLPGPSKIDAMMYNKTLFSQYGWSVPKSFDEFVSLCLQITEDTNGEVVPWNPNAKYSDEILKALEGFAYGEVFAGVDNITWYNGFKKGETTFAGHMEPCYAAIEKLVDNGILNEEFYSYSATARGKEFETGKIAMINYSVSAIGGDYEFGYMPYPATNGELGYVIDEFNCLFGVTKKEGRTEAESEAVQRFLEFLSSPDGQTACMGTRLMISNVRGVPASGGGVLSELDEAIDNGHTFALLRFESELGTPNFSFGGDALAMIRGERTALQCIERIDATPYIVPAAAEPSPVVATAREDFTILETSEFFADMYRERAQADVGLIANNIAYRGNLMRIFAGDIRENMLTVFKPRSFANDATLVKLSMTGAQLIGALNAPLTNGEIDSDCVYAFSGLKCKVAPWNALGEKYISAAMSDGAAIEPEKLYTVAAWAGTVRDEYVTEVLETCDGTFEEIFRARLEALGEIAPANDGRMELVWE